MGKKVNFEPDSAFRGEKKGRAKPQAEKNAAGEERRQKSEKAIGKNA
jgi:ribonuclease R